MLITELNIRNFKSYGNNVNTIKLNPETGELILIVGKNGGGKCVSPMTEIDIELYPLSYTDEELIKLMETMEKENLDSISRYIERFSEKANTPLRLKTKIGTIKKIDEKNLLNDVYVLTRKGYKKIKAVDITSKNSNFIKLYTKEFNIIVSYEHLLYSSDGWIETRHLKIGDEIDTINGFQKISRLELGSEMDLFDIEVDEVKEYYANGIVSHNSSILEAIDFTNYGKVRGKKKKYQTNASLPNRLNKNLETSIKFDAGKHKVEIKRALAPAHLKLSIDGNDYDRAGKSNIQDKINQIIGMDIDTFKSFISLSVNDFKNFMSLTNEEKKILLDKLFNLELINVLNKVLTDKKKQNKHQKEIYETEMRTYESSLYSFKQSIERLKKVSENSNDKQIEEYKSLINDKKDDFIKLQNRLKLGKEKEEILKTNIQTNQSSITDAFYKIKDYRNKISVFESGKCPTCDSELSDDTHQEYLNTMKETLSKLEDLNKELESEKLDINNKYNKLSDINNTTSQTFIQLKTYLESIKLNIKKLNDSKSDNVTNESVNELLVSISSIENKKKQSSDNLDIKDGEEKVMTELKKILSEDGIKKSIISKIVVPINHYISENLEKLNINFNVSLDDQFNAIVTIMGEEIELDSMSTGETKKVNIAIMLAYLKLIRMKKHVNLLFLDEVFSSIDVEGIYSILELLKDFARDNNINIFLIHHAMLDKSYFDKVLRIEKDITSNITEE